MRAEFRISLLCLALALLVSCGAGSLSQDEAAIRAGLQSSEDAWNRGDLKGHLAFYDAAVTFMTRDGPRPGVAGIEKAFNEKYFRDAEPKQRLRLDQIEVRALSGGGEPEQTGRFTTIWVRKADGWRAVHDHSS